MDQNLEDIDPDARKKYDRDMKAYAKEMEANEKKANARAQKAGYPTAEAEEKALREKAINELTEKKGTNLNKEAARATGEQSKSRGGGGGGGGGIDLEKGMMGGRMKKPSYKAGGKVSSASKRADGCAIRGKTRA
jgi:hypothetical protein